MIAARQALIHHDTAFEHRKHDPDFARQWQDACDQAIDRLEAVTLARGVEGDLEPVHYMGVVVGYVRKYDSRLQIELLRAHRPSKFKTPGTQVNIGVKQDIFVLTEEERHELMRINKDWLLSSPLPENDTVSPRDSDDLQLMERTEPAAGGDEQG